MDARFSRPVEAWSWSRCSLLVNIVNWSRPRLTSCLLKKQTRHQSDVCTPSSDCLVVYNQFVTLKKCMAATVIKFLRSRQENINNLKFESSWYEQYKRRQFCIISAVYKQHPASRLETKCPTGAPSSCSLALRSRSPQIAVELACSESIRFYSILQVVFVRVN